MREPLKIYTAGVSSAINIIGCPYIERMGATASREAMMMPISQMLAVSSSAQVGSPLALPCPKICNNKKLKKCNNVGKN